MFEKLTPQAESVATGLSVSRRGFLGRTGRGALAAAGALGALLAAPTRARAGGHPGGGCHQCYRECIETCGGDPNCESMCYFIWCVLFFSACLVFIADNKPALKAIKISPRTFFDDCSRTFHRSARRIGLSGDRG